MRFNSLGYRMSGYFVKTVLVLTAVASTQAQSEPGRPCNDALIRGDYAIQMQGTRPAPGGAIETVIGVVLRSFDGYGNFDQVDNIKGSITGIVPDRPGSGTYEVSSDCTGVTQFQPNPSNPSLVIEEKFVISENGNEIRSITRSPPPLLITAVAKRVHKP
jgi:hypothetical protein